MGSSPDDTDFGSPRLLRWQRPREGSVPWPVSVAVYASDRASSPDSSGFSRDCRNGVVAGGRRLDRSFRASNPSFLPFHLASLRQARPSLRARVLPALPTTAVRSSSRSAPTPSRHREVALRQPQAVRPPPGHRSRNRRTWARSYSKRNRCSSSSFAILACGCRGILGPCGIRRASPSTSRRSSPIRIRARRWRGLSTSDLPMRRASPHRLHLPA